MADFRKKCLERIPGPRSEGDCLIIGEVAQTHDGSLGLAHAFVDAIADAGADAVKFQTHIAEAESTPSEPWRVKFSRQDESRYDYWKRMEFTAEQWAGLKEHADQRGILFLSSPFSPEAVELLRGIGMYVWKIASGEVGNSRLLELAMAGNDPMILSSGMSGWSELDAAVEKVMRSGNPFAVLQCTSAYPCPPEKVGLNLLSELRERYSCPVGLSDHSGEIFAGLAASALGAEVLEVHVTLSREMFGPDVPVSVTTSELSHLVRGVRSIEKMISSPVDKQQMASELEPLRDIFTKSVYAGRPIPAGTVLAEEHFRLKKPGNGIPASRLPELIGHKILRDIETDELISIDDIEFL